MRSASYSGASNSAGRQSTRGWSERCLPRLNGMCVVTEQATTAIATDHGPHGEGSRPPCCLHRGRRAAHTHRPLDSNAAARHQHGLQLTQLTPHVLRCAALSRQERLSHLQLQRTSLLKVAQLAVAGCQKGASGVFIAVLHILLAACICEVSHRNSYILLCL